MGASTSPAEKSRQGAGKQPSSGAEGYLAYETLGYSGFLHALSNVTLLMQESRLLNRIPVLDARAPLNPQHDRNQDGGDGASKTYLWRDYLDLDGASALPPDGGQDAEPTPWPFLAVDDLPSWVADQANTLEVAADQAVPAKAPQMVWRRKTTSEGANIELASGIYRNFVPVSDVLPVPRTPLAKPLQQVAAKARKELGGDYWALHLRRRDYLLWESARYLFDSNSKEAALRLQEAGLTPDTKLFFMSDEPSRAFAAPLRSICHLVSERECRPLVELGRETRDNFQVFLAALSVLGKARRIYLSNRLSPHTLYTLGMGGASGYTMVEDTDPTPEGAPSALSVLYKPDLPAPLRYRAEWKARKFFWRAQRKWRKLTSPASR